MRNNHLNQKTLAFLSFLLVGIVLFGACSSDQSSPILENTEITHEIQLSISLPNAEPGGEDKYQTVLEEFSITNSIGNKIYGYIRRPDPGLYPGLVFAAVIKIPGGINPGRSAALGKEAITLAEAGMVVVTFNAQGRIDERNEADIRSEGEEDFNGFQNQDTLASIIRYIIGLSYVSQDNLGIRTQSYGITTAVGCAARYPDLPIKYIIDGEGPPSSFVTVQEPWVLFSSQEHPNHLKYETVYKILGHYSLQRDPSAANEAFWMEREAIRFIGDFDGMYLRLQGEWDHSQPPSRPDEIEIFHQPPIWWQGKHACDMVNAALEGDVPWIRINLQTQGNPVNQGCDVSNPPVFINGELNNNPMIPIRAVLEMARANPIP